MGELDIEKSVETNIRGNHYESSSESFSAPPADQIQVPTADTQTIRFTSNYKKWKGYYQNVPEYKAMIDRKATWVVGKGYEVKGLNIKTRVKLWKLRGNGKLTFNQILNNAVKVYSVNGDFYGEIVKDFFGRLTNLKPLDPSTITTVANAQGIITHYEQWVEVDGKQTMVNNWPADKIFHLIWQPMDAEIHGNGSAQQCASTMDSFVEAMRDLRTVFHRYVKPLLTHIVNTDDPTAIAAYQAIVEKASRLGEHLVVPKQTVDHIDRVSIPQFSTLDPLPWIKELTRRFFMSEGVPEVVMGLSGSSTEADSKMLYVSWEQVVEVNQLFLQEGLKAQMGIDIKLNFPRDILLDLQKDEKKDSKVNSNKKSEVNPQSKNS